jgi:hypothetical protein
MSNIKANADLLKHITQGVAAVASATRKMASSIDALHAGGMRSTDFISPKSKDGASTSSPEQFEAINTLSWLGSRQRGSKADGRAN